VRESGITVFPATGNVARVAQTMTPYNGVEVECGLPLVERKMGSIEGLPTTSTLEDGRHTYYIVSAMVKAAASGLTIEQYLVSPGELVRDEGGNVIGCKNFVI
jgi:hypothetical protein